MELSLQLKEREDELHQYEKEHHLSKNSNLQPIINFTEKSTPKESELKQEIEDLKLLLKESQFKLSDEDMIISKDQFKHIEKEFGEYKDKIELLKKENKELRYIVENSQQKGKVIDKLTALIPFRGDNIGIKFQKQQELKQV